MLRFHRQMILPQIGSDGQKKLQNGRVLIVGAGGLGHPVGQYLAAMGVGKIGIIDGDRVHISNLHRQVLFNEQDLNENKAEVLCKRIKAINPSLEVSSEGYFLDKEKAVRNIKNYDVVVDCTDNFETKFLINDVCSFYDKPMIYGAISQFEGQVGIFWKSKGACYRCLYRNIPASNIQSCSEAGVVGPTVGIVGSLQAMEVMKILVGRSSELNPLVGKINYYNFCDHTFRNLRVPQRPGCICHDEHFDISSIDEISTPVCKAQSLSALVDVRERDEWDEYHLAEGINFPLSELEKGRMPHLSKEQDIVLVCKSGVRARRARDLLLNMNFKNVRCFAKGVYEYPIR